MENKASDIAKIILRLFEPEYGDIISNLKLQKLLYYVQGFHLAVFGKPLFREDIEAWTYGPVVKEVYHEYKKYGNGAIPQPENDFEHNLTEEQTGLIIEVFDVYGGLSALKLMNMTHEELPWKSTSLNRVISHELMRSYFLTRLNNGEEN